MDEFVVFNFLTDHGIPRSGSEAFLKQRMHSTLANRSPFLLNKFINKSVHLEEKLVDWCRNGCLAYTRERSEETACVFCKAERFHASGRRAKTTRYWSIAAWLSMMLGNPNIGPDMMELMRTAREAAAAGSTSRDDWFNSDIFRMLLGQGKFSSDTDVAWSISAYGFKAWRQGGFQGWPITGTILSMPISTRLKIASQRLLTVTPGPREPKDLDSFLYPIMEELNILASGIGGLTVSGSDALHVLRVFLVQITTDMPAGDKLIHAKGHNGMSPGRFWMFRGWWSVSYRHNYFPN